MLNTQLHAQQLVYTYSEAGQKQTILKQAQLTLKRGESVALVGQSGSGKSTLLNLLSGIDRPDQGEIYIAEQSLRDLKEPQLTLFRRQHIGFIYQQFNLLPTLTVAENILLPLALLSVPAEQQQKRLHDWLNQVGLVNRHDAFPDQLSGGEQQRVAIARALIHEPALVLADEPTGNLDQSTGEKVLNILLKLAADRQQTLLMVTHSEAVAARCQRTVKLVNGELHTVVC